ncbi:MAG: type IV pilus modification protein PilV [Gammaproteobacteria bacterium]|nr:type IV pilus modification protein PilV [Gammaproteobacteria bacterium]
MNKLMKVNMHKPERQSGFSLVEVLVTLIVTSVALLSSATLQLQSKRSMYDSAQRTTAAHMANDLFSRMRANPTELATYVPVGTIGNGTLAVPADNCLNPAVTCTDTQLAIFDLWQWEQHLDGQLETNNLGAAAGGLLTPTVCITGPPPPLGAGAAGYYTVAIAWRGLTNTGNPIVNNCGAGSGNYGAGDAFRRVLVVQSFLSVT